MLYYHQIITTIIEIKETVFIKNTVVNLGEKLFIGES